METKMAAKHGSRWKFFSRMSQVQFQPLSNKFLAGKLGEEWGPKLGRKRFPTLDFCLLFGWCLLKSISVEFEDKVILKKIMNHRERPYLDRFQEIPFPWKQHSLSKKYLNWKKKNACLFLMETYVLQESYPHWKPNHSCLALAPQLMQQSQQANKEAGRN